MKSLKWLAFLGVAALVLCFSPAVSAQTQGGALQGKVVDEAGQSVAGAGIEVSGRALQGVQRTTTDVEGQYVIPFLPVGGGYEVKVEASGYGTVVRKGIDIPLGVTVSLPFTLGQGKTEITVTAPASALDPRKTETGAEISDRMINAIPLPRNSSAIAFLAPGAVPSGIPDNPSIGGASGLENTYSVNGVDVTGSFEGRAAMGLNFDFIQATEVQTGGLDAEYGGLMGGGVNAITKSGGNEFHGSAFAYYFDDSLGAKEDRLDNPNVTDYRKSFKQYDIGGSLGGYFVKDKLWFFAAYDYNRTEEGFTANGTDGLVTLNGRPSYSWARDSGYQNESTDPQYALKLTWNASPNHKLALSFFGDNRSETWYRNLQNPVPTASPFDRKTDNYALSVQWNATWTPTFFTEVVLSRRDSKFDSVPKNRAAMDNWGYYYAYSGANNADWGFYGYEVIPEGPPNRFDPTTFEVDLSGWRPSLGGHAFHHTRDTNDQIRIKATNLFSGFGRHEVSYGLQHFDVDWRNYSTYTGPSFTENYPGDPFYGRSTSGGVVIAWSYDEQSPTSWRFFYRGFMSDSDIRATQSYSAYWVQDNWNLTDYFMLKLGLRLDQQRITGGRNTRNVPDQISPGHGYADGTPRSLYLNDEWAPRVGFTWDVARNGKSKLYGFWGRYYHRDAMFMTQLNLTDTYFHFGSCYDPALTMPVPDPSSHFTGGLYPTQVVGGPSGQKIEGAYADESILGFQYEVRPDLSLGVRAVYRSLGRAIEDISFDGGYTGIVTNPDRWTDVWQPDPYGRPGYRWLLPRPVRIYKALELTADKRFSNRWLLQGSYVLSRLEGNYEGMYWSEWDAPYPNSTPAFDLPELMVNAYGLLPADRTHVLRVYGAYYAEKLPLELSGGFFLQSGTPISAVGSYPFWGPGAQGVAFCQPRGTAGRTPTTWSLDLGVQYTFKLWKTDLALRADIFNVTNEQKTTAVDQLYNAYDTSLTQTNPYYKKPIAHQPARRVRIALRWSF